MVRRWSYINSINSSIFVRNSFKTKLIINALRISTFKATTYYWETLHFDNITSVTRKSYYRRKHINTLILYQNIVTSWSKDYLFFRKYSKSILNLNFSKYNYLSQNLFLSKSQDISNLLGFDTIKLTFIPNLVYSFTSLKSINILPFFVRYKGPYLYISSNEKLTSKVILNTALKDTPTYLITGNNLYSNINIPKKVNSINFFLESIFRLFLAKNISYYSIFVLAILK